MPLEEFIDDDQDQPSVPETQKALKFAYTGAVLSWLKTLVSNTNAKLQLGNLPLGMRLGAAFPGVILMTMMMGCSQEEIVSCSKDEQEFLENVKMWINEHPEEIQAKMDELWPNQTITAKYLIKTLNNSQIGCAIGFDSDTTLAVVEEVGTDSNKIFINVDTVYFSSALDAYQRGEWTQDYSLDELAQLATEDEIGVRMDSLFYYNAVSHYADVLAHEAAHLALDVIHKEGIGKQAVRKDMYQRAELDQVYAWGSAAGLVASNEGCEIDSFLNDSVQ